MMLTNKRISPYSSISPPYLIFPAGGKIRRIKPDGTNYQTLVSTYTDGAISVDYQSSCFSCSKLFWTRNLPGSNEYDGVYQAELGTGNNPKRIIDVDNPRGLAVDGDMLYFSYQDGTVYHIAEHQIGAGPSYLNIETTNDEIGELVVNGLYLIYTVGHEVFRKDLLLLGGLPEKIYEASNSNVCIFSLGFKAPRAYWAESCSGDGIHSVIANDPNPQQTHESILAPDSQYGVAVYGDKVYWTAVGKVIKALRETGASMEDVIDLGTTEHLKGIVIVKP